MRLSTLSAAVLAVLSAPALAETDDDNDNSVVERIQIIGSQEDARTVAGSSAVIDEEQMEVETVTDIHQVLKTVPGLYIREEDGFGLRPNIGVRAATAGRVSKVTLLEDGVMMAPAPYSNPAAYYFPTAFRMNSIEILKGAPMLRYGPQTTGGVLNLVTTPIPESFGGQVLTQFGDFGTHETHAFVGDYNGTFGYLLETSQRDSQGFKEIDRSNRDSGFAIEDYVAKFLWTGDRQSLLVKLQYSEETSNETYAGLTDADFAENPNRRYGLSSIDQMTNHHDSINIHYDYQLSDMITLGATVYSNNFHRDWFKAGVVNGLVSAANQGDANAQAILDGAVDLEDITYTHGNRAYGSQGIELHSEIALADHAIEVGMRSHEDDMNRYQLKEVYDQINGSLVFDSFIQPTGGDNRIERAEALSFWITDQWQVSEDLNLNLALRYEDVDSSRRQFATPERTDTPSFRSNSSDLWLPGASFTYDVNDNWQVLAGAHKGFSPLGGGATANQEPETSLNYEAGVRYRQDAWFVEAIGFYSDFSDTTQLCSIANPCDNGAESGTYVLGESVVSGLELQVSNTFAAGDYLIPVDLSYTYTQAEISENNAVTGLMDGDVLNDVPENTLSLRVTFDNNKGWLNYVVVKYIDEMCVSVGCNRNNDPSARTESLVTADLVSRYELSRDMTVYFKLENVFDEQVIIARSPHGARPNKPQTAMFGLQYNF
ncbi:TonB-dependent receptor domain-containing protein [Aliidiomarina sp. B3213]|nr:TonB-dependent receptor [Aliidiomarina sp. B3213]RTE87721.1 TonB-dependent receptor [Aliidiomarina sp. B3213]TCZ93401.1 TonB-dependent receptor [Lysobacter sp. N42]